MKFEKWKMAKAFAFLLVALLVSYSCSDPAIEYELQKHNSQEIDISDPLYQFITEGLGISPDDVVDRGDMYVAEGDIMFNKSYFVVPEEFKKSKTSDASFVNPPVMEDRGEANGRTQQWIANYTTRVDRSVQRDITVSIHSSVPSSGLYNIRPHITEAIQKWNNLSCTEIRFRLVTGRRGHIEIKDDGGTLTDSPRLVLGSTDFPSGGFPGRTLLLNIDQMIDNNFATGLKTGIIMHELGHAVGIIHTNWFEGNETAAGGEQIPLSPTTDDLSVFIRGLPLTNDFSFNDREAIEIVYPAFSNNTTCRAPLFYYWSRTLSDAFFTTQLTDKGGTEFWNYSYQGIECYVHTAPVPFTTIPLYRYYSESTTDHALSISEMGNGWRLERTYYISPSPGPGRVALHEHYSSSRNDHFYTVRSGNFTGYSYRSIVGYVWTADN